MRFTCGHHTCKFFFCKMQVSIWAIGLVQRLRFNFYLFFKLFISTLSLSLLCTTDLHPSPLFSAWWCRKCPNLFLVKALSILKHQSVFRSLRWLTNLRSKVSKEETQKPLVGSSHGKWLPRCQCNEREE